LFTQFITTLPPTANNLHLLFQLLPHRPSAPLVGLRTALF
jgi:hypothetical protein